jgi:ribonuclease T1
VTVGRKARAWAVAFVAVLGLVAGCSGSTDTDVQRTIQQTTTAGAGQYTGTDPESGLPWVARSELPPEAIDTLQEIADGPPYEYDRDGVTFENREGLLPDEEAGYYQEFTVVTPGSSDRGARRIIWGLQDELYYTDDHYQSFERIAP